MQKDKVKIFLGFSEVSNYYTNLLKGFKKLDIEYEFVVFGENARSYEYDLSNSLIQKAFNRLSRLQTSGQSKILKSIFYLLHVTLRVPLFIQALFKYNVFIFNYNSSFFGLYDLPLLKFFNKKVIYIFFGSDSRPPYMSGNYIYENYSVDQVYTIAKRLNSKNRYIEKYADYIICAYPSAQFFNRDLIHFLALGIPMDLSHIDMKSKDKGSSSKSCHIIHAPSTKKQKGSAIFQQIIQELQNEGYDIFYEEIFNMPNRKVLEQLVVCDFVLDEIYSDTTLAGLATEAAFFSKPTIVGSYYTQIAKDLKSLPVPPSSYVEPTEIKSAIIKLIEDKEYRVALGKMAKVYIETKWSPETVATSFLSVINDDTPKDWFYDASKVDYFYGWGVSDEALKIFLKQYIDRYGKEGLFLSHNPSLENQILRFIKE